MLAVCQPLPRSAVEDILQTVARAICDRPADNQAQREARTSQMVHTTMGFEPRDGLEYMLSTMVFAHFNLILDSMHEVFQGQMDSMKARTKTTIVALDRSMIAMVRELREARKRPLSKSAEDAKRTAEADTASPTAGAKPPGEPLPSPVEIVPATIKPAATVSTSKPAKPAEPHAAHVVPLHAQDRPPVVPARHKPAPAVSPPPSEDDDGTLEAHVAAFQEALAAAAESLAEARALDDAKLTAATGD